MLLPEAARSRNAASKPVSLHKTQQGFWCPAGLAASHPLWPLGRKLSRCVAAVGVAPEIPIYFVFFDIMNCIGHCNFECMPIWAQARSRRRCCYDVLACAIYVRVCIPQSAFLRRPGR